MEKEEFIESYCVSSDISKDTFNELMVALPCNCGNEFCRGWAAISNNEISIKAHNDIYGKSAE